MFFTWFILILIGVTAEKERAPNVLVILTDDQGWGDHSLNCFAYVFVLTLSLSHDDSENVTEKKRKRKLKKIKQTGQTDIVHEPRIWKSF